MKSILEYIQEKLNIIEPSIPIVEMATIDKTVKVSKNTYRIALHGPAVGDRPCPHFHIYLANDVYPYKRFNIEISLIDLLCYDELNIVAIQDKEKKINPTLPFAPRFLRCISNLTMAVCVTVYYRFCLS